MRYFLAIIALFFSKISGILMLYKEVMLNFWYFTAVFFFSKSKNERQFLMWQAVLNFTAIQTAKI